MRIGVAQADITPAPGGQLSGYVARQQPSLGVHDPLLATALFLESGGSRLLIFHAEVVAHEFDDCAVLKAALATESPDLAHVLVTATHTHSGPATVRLNECGEYDAAYVARLRGTFLRLARAAGSSAEEASLCFAEGRCDLGIDRRGGAHALPDPRVPVFGWRRADGSWVAAMAAYAMHNVAMGPENRLVSGDVAGEAARRLSARLGAPAVFLNGACGNINPPSVGPDFARVEEWGGRLAGAAGAALEAVRPARDETLRILAGTWEAARYPAPSEQEQALAAEFANAGEGPVAERIGRAHARWREAIVRQDGRARGEVALTSVRVGPACLACFGAEVFAHIGDDLREATGLPVYPVCYAGGDAGYVAPGWAYDEGGYETKSAFVYYGTNPIARGAYVSLRDTVARDLLFISRDSEDPA